MSTSSVATARMLQSLQEMPEVLGILRTVRRLTELRITLVARVSEGKWTCAAVVDDAAFGLEAGSSLDVSTTY